MNEVQVFVFVKM